jgi:sec-independent protein translocase protein TatA
MGSLSIWHWIVVIAVILLLFGGRGKISSLMGDFASGIKAFKKGMSEDETAKAEPPAEPKPIDHQQTAQTPPPAGTAPSSTSSNPAGMQQQPRA